MGLDGIVRFQSCFGDGSGFGQSVEYIQVKHLLPTGSIEPLNIGILCRLTWLNEVEQDTLFRSPCFQFA